MEEFKSNVSEEKETEQKEEIKSNRPARPTEEKRKGVIYAQPLRAEGNDSLKKAINERRQREIEQADQKEEGVRIQFADSRYGREVFEEIVDGFNGQKRTKVVDILIHEGTSVHKYPAELAKKMVKFFGKRATIVE